jgi:hypothetical protein
VAAASAITSGMLFMLDWKHKTLLNPISVLQDFLHNPFLESFSWIVVSILRELSLEFCYTYITFLLLKEMERFCFLSCSSKIWSQSFWKKDEIIYWDLKPAFEGLWNYGAGLVLGSFEDTRYRSEFKSSALEKVELIGLGVGKELQEQISRTVYQCAGVILARQLVNSPANVLTPSKYAFPFSSNHCRRMYIIYL